MAAHGGGAWKVAYADFVTAMMAFFLVMWICGQDQKIRRSVSEYFSDPLGASDAGSNKKPTRSGGISEGVTTGSVPLEESVAMGQGRRTHTTQKKSSPSTRLVHEWLHRDPQLHKYWKKQAQDQRESARWSKDVKENIQSVEKVAIRQMMLQLQDEMKRDIPAKTDGIYRELLHDALLDVNWREIAEDLIGQ